MRDFPSPSETEEDREKLKVLEEKNKGEIGSSTDFTLGKAQ